VSRPPEPPQSVYLALGTNLGDRQGNLTTALQLLREHVTIEQCSAVYETEPAYVTEQPHFLNMVVRGTTALSPHALLAFLKHLERTLGRQPGQRYGPRLIDLDILFYGEAVLNTPDLIIPHPRFAERAFVLLPLAEIAPNLVPPGSDQPIAALAEQVGMQGAVVRRGA
jgi:2-amino-4-hydroxy-6-hydroxymethyldihydropteridine diphosphokinase